MDHQHHEEVSVSEADHHLPELEMLKTNVLMKPPKFSCDPCCSFSKQGHSFSDSEQRSKSTTKLCGLMCFYLLVMTVEIVGGLKANSLAVLTDAAHLLTDIGGFSISLFTMWAAGWTPTTNQSFGFNRAEVLGALLSVQLIWIVSGYLIFEALERMLQKHADVNGELMFAVAAFGFVINFIMVIWLGHGHDHTGMSPSHVHEEEGTSLVVSGHDNVTRLNHGHDHGACVSHGHGQTNINVEGAYLHVMADMIQSVGVMIAGVVIWVKPEWLMVDLVCTLIFSVLALGTTLTMLRSVFSILMERTPLGVDVFRMKNDLENIEGVHDVHDLHVWAITQGKNVLACHMKVESSVNSNKILDEVRGLCDGTYGIHHVTVQIEHD